MKFLFLKSKLLMVNLKTQTWSCFFFFFERLWKICRIVYLFFSRIQGCPILNFLHVFDLYRTHSFPRKYLDLDVRKNFFDVCQKRCIDDHFFMSFSFEKIERRNSKGRSGYTFCLILQKTFAHRKLKVAQIWSAHQSKAVIFYFVIKKFLSWIFENFVENKYISPVQI